MDQLEEHKLVTWRSEYLCMWLIISVEGGGEARRDLYGILFVTSLMFLNCTITQLHIKTPNLFSKLY